MQRNKTEHQSLEILDQVVEYPQSLGVRRIGYVVDGAYLGSLDTMVNKMEASKEIVERGSWHLERDDVFSNPNLQFLFAVLVLFRPFRIVLPICPCQRLETVPLPLGAGTNFMISLCLIMRLISSMTKELTHTAGRKLAGC